MHIEVCCTRCGVVSTHTHWSPASTEAAIHEHQPARVVGVMTKSEWGQTPRDYKRTPRAVLTRDADGSTILIPVEVR